MNARNCLAPWFCALSLIGAAPVHAQTKASAQDIQNLCEVADIPAVKDLSVTWTGDCADGKAAGVGDVLAFSAGELRYILRGAFTAGRLTRLDDIQNCQDDRCSDKVAPAVLRQHSVLYELSQGVSSGRPDAPAGAAPAPSVPGPAPAVVTAPPVVSPRATPAPQVQTPEAAAAAAPQEPLVPPAPIVEIRAKDAVYMGRFLLDKVSGVISGEGRVQFADGQVYEGRLEAGRKMGRGTYIWADGQRYTGQWRDDQQEGEGEWRSPRGDVYVGSFRAGRRTGQGRMVYADASEYEGGWLDDKPSGQGRLKFANGDVYEGQFVAGEQTGTGVLKHRNGDQHSGAWVRGMREGKGLSQWKDGQRYEGDWRANLKEGQGVMRFADGGSYEGAWVQDRPMGQGVIRFASGDTYTGQVRDGLPEGQGVYVWGSGDKFEGVFAAGRPSATGVMTFYIPPPTEAASAPQQAPAGVPAEPQVAEAPAAEVQPVAVSAATLCSRAYNRARTVAALRKFMESFPQDECDRHALANKKIAALEENERKLAAQRAEREAQAQALVGLVVAFRQDHTQCVGPQGSCQNVIYSFEVKGKIREVNVARQNVTLQVLSVALLANDKGAPADLFAQGQSAATESFRKRMVGTIQTRTEAEVGMEF